MKRLTPKILKRGRYTCYKVYSKKIWISDKEPFRKKIFKYFEFYLKRIGKFNSGFKRANLMKKCGKLTPDTIKVVYERNIIKFKKLTCYLCYKPIILGDDSVEHKIPVSRRKEFPNIKINNKDNLDIAHLRCNLIKHDMTVKEYRIYMRRK